jgi:hypothetical protein
VLDLFIPRTLNSRYFGTARVTVEASLEHSAYQGREARLLFFGPELELGIDCICHPSHPPMRLLNALDMACDFESNSGPYSGPSDTLLANSAPEIMNPTDLKSWRPSQ